MQPLYKDEHHTPPRTRGTGHPGLWFERFYNRYQPDWQVDATAKRDFLQSLLGHGENEHQCQVGDVNALQQQANALASIAQQQGGLAIERQSSWHFLTGLGNPHPVENGLTWHSVLGVPYLPGSAVKGITRAWLELNGYDAQVRKRLFGSDDKDPREARTFADEPELISGEVIFFDALPVEPVTLMIDTMTPHMGKWYESGDKQPGSAANTPADWHAPNPVVFLAATKVVMRFAVAPRLRPGMTDDQREEAKALAELASQALSDALEHLGAGAKTAAGYGTFVALDEDNQRKADRRLKDYEADRQAQAEQAALAQLSPEQRTLEALKKGMDVPANQNAGSGGEFHRELLTTLEGAVDWPQPEQDELITEVRRFMKQYRLKNKEKEAKRIIREVLKREL
ncbi:type III-B CRISPR module RAMP protein Cmr6 [Halomonas sp. GFAJ-1]|uniref:type III-B CRISPR module RAMP protein Cmr6 n=1 Tax=Halomonas sp. GFAJ-1 TaxID=1118153 RepID=UPI00023A33C4|nr:type III-B CRISPR module RAMP protein Cmr6 [Halomonas sp. GFAJ-1]AVI62974.1 type III-B CRISPR module RAMP protein Cmr6 [Halomonas sp. GFAJ-1]EHK60280.1 CRISPR-associated RAMP protein, Cmr6 family [Halomonas sp. GFAJ-1]